MAQVSENGILDRQAFEEYKSRSVRAKFLNQIFLGVGAATVFGVVSGLVHALLGTLEGATLATMFTGSFLAPTLGLMGLAVFGVFSLYIGAKYVAKSIMLDQDFQAKKIGIAARGVDTQLDQGRTTPLMVRGAVLSQTDETPEASDPRWAEKFSRHDPEKAWADRAQQPAASDLVKGA